MYKKVHSIRNGLRRFNRWAGVLKSDPYELGLSLSQSSALIDIDRFDNLKPNKLAQLLNLDKSSVSRLITVLKNKNFIKIIEDSVDKRSKNLTLTSSGKDLVQKIHKISDQSVIKALSILSNRDQKKIALAFDKLALAVEKLENKND